MRKSFLGLALLIFLGTGIGFILAETLAVFLLPAPVPQKLPLIRMKADDVCGYRHQPNQKGYTLSGRVTINQWGFRGKDWKMQKPSGVIRIALLGDSAVFGQGVNDEETFAQQLELILSSQSYPYQRYEVLNFAADGYDTGHEMKVLENDVVKFQPDIVILHFFLNDLFFVKDYKFYPEMFSQNEKQFSLLRWWFRELIRRSRFIMAVRELWLNQHSLMTEIENAYFENHLMPPSGPAKEGWYFTLDKLAYFKGLSLAHSFEPVLVIIPTLREILSAQEANYQDFLIQKGHDLGISSISLLPAFSAKKSGRSKLVIPYDYHLSKEGHRMAAEFLANTIRSMEIRPPASKRGKVTRMQPNFESQ